MGGKHKQAQRVKNNARPSSSSRSAELLGTHQFTGFANMKEAGFATPLFSLPTTDTLDSSLDGNFQLVLKKMNKKDATTRLKALQEFSDLVKQSDCEIVKTILPFWPRLYSTLATDTDHKVREATHLAHDEIILKVKRNIAPYLKQLVGAWFTSQYDTYPPAASAASKAFKDAFPSYKVKEVISFCQEEILSYIYDNLITQTPQTMLNPKLFSEEECKDKYERLLIASLHGYALYINEFTDADKLSDLNGKIIAHNKFWKLAHYEKQQIRTSFYSLLAILCERVPDFLKDSIGNLSKVVLSNLDEKDTLVQANIWQCALLVIKNFEDCSKHINYGEKVLPKLWKVLREGAYGNATVIYPNLLPLISRLYLEEDIENFSFKFFDSMRQGLRQNTIKTSSSESRAVSLAFVECLQYTIMQNHTKIVICNTLIKNQLIPFIEFYLDDSKSAHKTLFSQVAALLHYWYKYKDNDYPNYAKFIETFWTECENLLKTHITNVVCEQSDQNAITLVTARHVEFIISLKHVSVKQKALKVKFVSEDNANRGRRDSRSSLTTLNEDYIKSLKKLAFNICILYMKLVGEKKLPALLDEVCTLVQEFEDDAIMDILKINLLGSSDGDTMKIFDLLFEFINDKEFCTKSAVHLMFFLLKYSPDDVKSNILQHLLQILNDELFAFCACFALSYPFNTELEVQKWLKDEKVGNYFVKLMDNKINNTSTPEATLLLKQVFTETNNGELFIETSCSVEVLNRLIECIKEPLKHKETIDNCASFASIVSTVVYSETSSVAFDSELFLALLSLDCQMSHKSDHGFLSKDTLWEVNASWQDAFYSIAVKSTKEEFLQLVDDCLRIFESTVRQKEQFDYKKIVDFVLVVEKSRPLLISNVISHLDGSKFLQKTWLILQELAKLFLYLNGSIADDSICKIKEINYEEDIVFYYRWKILLINVLKTALDEETNYDDDDEDQFNVEVSMPKTTETILKFVDNVEEVILQLLADFSLLDILINGFKQTLYYQILLEHQKNMTDSISNLLQCLPEEKSANLSNHFKEMIKKQSATWSFVAYHYFIELNKQDSIEVYEKLSSNIDSKNCMQLTQIFAQKQEISFDEMNHGLSDLESIVTLKSLLHCDDIDVQIAQVFARIEKLRDEKFRALFYNIDLENVIQMEHFNQILLLFCELVKSNKANSLSRRQWDFILVSLGSWSSKLEFVTFKECWQQPHIMLFIISIGNLYTALCSYLKELNVEEKSSFIDEWENVFNKSIAKDLLKLWLYFSEYGTTDGVSLRNEHLVLFQKFGQIIDFMHPKIVFGDVDGMPKWSSVLKQSCSLLLNSTHCLQLWGYHMLRVLAPGLVNVDSIAVDTNTRHEKGLIFEQFKGLLTDAHTVVSTMLLEFKLGESSCTVQPFTDSYTYTSALLLLWDILIILCEQSPTDLRYNYSDWLKKEDLLSNIMSCLFKLMPVEVLQSNQKLKDSFGSWYLEKPSLQLSESISSDKIARLSCWVYSAILSQLPANVRQWWSNAEIRITQLVERITTLYVSQQLCVRELQELLKYQKNFANMTIKVHPTIREVVAIYTIDDSQMELNITLPPNYPLGGPDVQCSRVIGGLAQKQWLMQLRMCLLHQNGRIWDAISLWNQNLDKKFDGLEECYICFAILHVGTYQLPKLSCKTCRKKFHAACLHKWFNTSFKSTCPICRNLF